MLFGKTVLPSEKNGSVDVRYSFGKAEVYVNGYDQSTGYVDEMWRIALKRIPKSPPPRHVLMLGLGGGSAITHLQKQFRACTLTVVEWDPVMIEIYHGFHSQNKPISVLQGDAIEIIPALQETFDLVVVDLFTGNKTPEALASHKMVGAIANVVAPNGFCLLNAFISLNLPPVFDAHFTQQDAWVYKLNHLFLYGK